LVVALLIVKVFGSDFKKEKETKPPVWELQDSSVCDASSYLVIRYEYNLWMDIC
jgi:hypothetical protein